jgi:oligopeptide/dipeptide ABC transporter ATP-binding protein
VSRPQTDQPAPEAPPAGKPADDMLLEVRDLFTAFPTSSGVAFAVNGISLSVRAGSSLGIVGESGSGKSMTCRSILGLVPRPGAVVGGSIRWRGQELVGAPERRFRRLRGSEIGMIFQDPASALNPVFSIGAQITETISAHTDLRRSMARAEAVELLGRVGIPSPRDRFNAYPHQLSGGMRQRAMIALAISCRPALILADEPTTNLDVTIQDQILNLLADLREERGMAVVLVSHDLGVISQTADTVIVMYAGYIVERAPIDAIFTRARHPYTRGLIRALPSLRAGSEREPLVPIEGQPPELDQLPPGCPFQPRCPRRREACSSVDMALASVAGEHLTACPFEAELPDG